ncbi:cell wall hydrolase [Amaricoccus macauensis]|uniref:cell wall hydrolase n=1 Tax=Amaricoccus macauensis TaxID=57001 RepID=UPI003C7B2538
MKPIRNLLAALGAAALVTGCAMPPETPEVEAPPSRAAANPQDLSCLAEAIYFEARGTGQAGTEAVAHVVVNRAKNPEFPNSVCGVVADRCQFAYRCDGIPETYAEPLEREKALRTAEKVLTGAPDITKGALFFHAAWAEPGWFNTRPRVGKFGGNVFYR